MQKQILCKLKTICNGDPIKILVHFKATLMINKLKENYAMWQKKIKIEKSKNMQKYLKDTLEIECNWQYY